MSDINNYKRGDLLVVGDPPPKLTLALAAVADKLHQTFAVQPWIEHREKSKESCVLSSLAVRDFLISVGFLDAQVRPVATVMRATRGDETLHSLGIGVPGPRDRSPRHWNGHMVATTGRYLIDTTLYRANRPQWRDLPGMMALPFRAPEDVLIYGGRPFAGATIEVDGGATFELLYLDTPSNTRWQDGGDVEERRREAAVAAMREHFEQGRSGDGVHLQDRTA